MMVDSAANVFAQDTSESEGRERGAGCQGKVEPEKPGLSDSIETRIMIIFCKCFFSK